MLVNKTLIMRARKDVVAVFKLYERENEKPNASRPQAALDFLSYVAGLKSEDAVEELKTAAFKVKNIDVSDLSEESMPTSIKIPIAIEEKVWTAANNAFINAFDLKKPPQTPYLIKVSGMAYLTHLMERHTHAESSSDNEIDALRVKAMRIVLAADKQKLEAIIEM